MDEDKVIDTNEEDGLITDDEEIANDNIEDTDEDDIFVNWTKTAYVPEPHLITEEAFNSLQPSYEKYFLKFQQKYNMEVNNKVCSEFTNNVTSKSAYPTKDVLSNRTKDVLSNSTKDVLYKPAKDVVSKPTKDVLSKPAKDVLSDTTMSVNRNKDITTVKTMLSNHTKYHLLSKPRFSCISEADVHFYVSNYNQLHSDDDKRKQRFKEIQLRVMSEQQEYQGFLRFSAQHHLNEYLYISSNIKEKVQNENFKDVAAVLGQKNAYSQIQTIEITQEYKKTPFNFIGNVYSQKNVDVLKPSTCLKNLSQRLTPCKKKLHLNEKEILDLSEESSFYIKEASFINIFESFVLNKCEWLIPITVKHNGKLNKSVLVDNPLPKRSITVRDTYSKFYKECLKDLYSDSQSLAEPRVPSVNAFLCGEFKLLIETEIDFIDPLTKRTYSLLPKPEMQCNIGFELFSIVELCKAWWKSRVANTDCIICSRIDVRNDCLARTDIYTRDMLCSHGSPYNPNTYFSYLVQLLENLYKCEPGDYLLERFADNKNLLLFKKDDNGHTTLDMKYSDRVLKKDFFKELEFPWLPIDCNIGNQLIANKVIPCLFPRCINKPNKKSKRSRKSRTRKRANISPVSSAKKKSFFREDQDQINRPRKSRSRTMTDIPLVSSVNDVDFFSEEVPSALSLKRQNDRTSLTLTKRQNVVKPCIRTNEDIIEF